MRKINFILFGLLIGFLSFSQTMAQNSLDTPANQKKFIKDYAEKLEKRFKDKSAGYAFVVTYKADFRESRAGGDARRFPDANPRKMTINDKFNIASVNKTMTAAAVMKLLNQKKDPQEKTINIDIPMHAYLPPDWKMGPDSKTITFRELLTHLSGIRCGAVFYDDTKLCTEKGILINDKKTYVYQNTNFVLFRFIIPKLWQENFKSEGDPKFSYSKAYNMYMLRHIFLPIGLDNIDTKPTDPIPALAYQFPTPVKAGTDFGDFTENNAAGGFHMSARQLSTFVSSLMFTDKIVPVSVREQMKKDRLGLYPVTHAPNLSEWGHAGILPGSHNPGEINTMIVTYSNGVTISLIINSQFGPKQDAWANARDAMLEMINNK